MMFKQGDFVRLKNPLSGTEGVWIEIRNCNVDDSYTVLYFDYQFDKAIEAEYQPNDTHSNFEILEHITLTKEVADIFRTEVLRHD